MSGIMQNNKVILSGMSLQEMESFLVGFSQPKFRAKQLHYWIYKKSACSFDEMTNISKDLRVILKEQAQISRTKIKQKLISKDGTIKYLLELCDKNTVEAVLMRFEDRPNLAACVSSQVGCPVNCAFCATGKSGFIRNLDYKEIVDQILTIQRDSKLKVTNIVYMGQGEPLLNYDNVIKSIKMLNQDLDTGMRRITISTSGIIPGIKKLSDENRQLTLALSLHAPNHEIRKKIIPVEDKYNINELISALKVYSEKTGRRVTIEYTLIEKLNDELEHAKQLINLLKGLNCNINLIPYNPVEGVEYKSPSKERINSFKRIVERFNRKVTLRLERGSDIKAACGQLSGKAL